MGLIDSLGFMLRTLEPRKRRSYATEVRAHIEFRNVEGSELEEFSRQVSRASRKLSRVKWVEVNPHTKRVVFAHEHAAYTIDELERVVAEAERAAHIDQPESAEWSAEHPADFEPIERLQLEFSSEVLALLLGLGLKVTPLRPSALAGSALGLIALFRATRLRTLLEDQLGAERSKHVLNLAGAFTQAAAQRPASSLVDALHKRALLLEALARRDAWIAREPEYEPAFRGPHWSVWKRRAAP